jgi:hypothetical protein
MTSAPNQPAKFPILLNWNNKSALRAYALYEARGCADGHDFDDWLQAEAEILGKKTASGTKNDRGEALFIGGLWGLKFRVVPGRKVADDREERMGIASPFPPFLTTATTTCDRGGTPAAPPLIASKKAPATGQAPGQCIS